ncbi:MAG: ABC transporter ATP-binding protein [Erysipelotrichaceae bacterium]
MKTAINISNLTKHYPDFKLNSISFNVPSGYITGFIGPNGAGKTTSLKSILNLIQTDSGQINVFDQPSYSHSDIGIVMDMPFFVEDWTLEDVEIAIKPFYSNWDSTKYHSYLNQFNLNKSKKIKELSRGMKVKLMLASALSHHAKLLILDEPTSGLDPVAREEICDILSEFVSDEDHSVFFSTHITSDLEKIADYIVFILNGTIVFSGEKDELIERYKLIKGGLDELDEAIKTQSIGLRKHSTGFEALYPSELCHSLNESILIETCSLDEIIVHMNKELKQ